MFIHMHIYIYIHTYIYLHVERERERERVEVKKYADILVYIRHVLYSGYERIWWLNTQVPAPQPVAYCCWAVGLPSSGLGWEKVRNELQILDGFFFCCGSHMDIYIYIYTCSETICSGCCGGTRGFSCTSRPLGGASRGWH